jgi:hypothetical protein
MFVRYRNGVSNDKLAAACKEDFEPLSTNINARPNTLLTIRTNKLPDAEKRSGFDFSVYFRFSPLGAGFPSRIAGMCHLRF